MIIWLYIKLRVTKTLNTDYLISQKYRKCSPGKYAMFLYVAVSIRWISIRFDFQFPFLRIVSPVKICNMIPWNGIHRTNIFIRVRNSLKFI